MSAKRSGPGGAPPAAGDAGSQAEPDDGGRRRGRPRQGRPVARHLPRDDEILKIAAEVFFEQGYNGAKLEDIAKQAGIVKGSLYHYFESKEHMYERLIDEVKSLADIGAEAKSDLPVEDRLAEIVRRRVELVVRNPVEIGIISRHLVRMDGKAGEWARSYRRNFLHGLRDIIEEGQATGTFRPGDPDVLATFILGTITVITEWYRPGGRLGAEEIAEEMVAFVLQGVGVRPTRRRTRSQR
ncbi:MAG: TetR/AcrR family transcriptional regulator [Actinomycetota bacterium]|jgi:TetR/AcrR family transcriptional regulator, cholesterol catabolism regulator